MTDFLYLLTYLCSSVMRLSAVYRLFGVYCDRSGIERKKEYLAYGGFWLINALNNLLIGVPVLNAIGTIATLLGLTFLYPGKFLEKLARALGLLCLFMLCEAPVYALMMVFQVPQDANMLVGTPIAQLILFLFSLALKQRHTPQMSPRISRLYWLAILAIPCGTLLLVLIICREYERLGGMMILMFSCILLVLNLLTFYVLDRLEEYSAAYYEKELLTRQNRAYRAEFDLMRQSERQTSVLRHDMKNHLAVLREYAAQGKLQELERYLDAFGQKLIRPGLIHTGNPDIDSILNYKLGQAEAAGARLELDVTLPESFTADAFDLNIILGNLLDNAVEALPASGDRWIALSLRVDRGVFFLRIANSYDGMTFQTAGPDGPIYRSRKKGEGHGLGLGIVRRIVDKYHGELQIESAEAIFTVEAILYLKE